MREDDRIRVGHMIEAGDSIRQFMSGRDRTALDTDRMLLFAVVRAIEVIGEAASKVSQEARDAAKAIPWRSIIGMRNRIVHAYWDIDTEIVWKTVTEEIPALLPLLRGLMGEGERGP